jgi:hypothetical protein
MSRLWITPEEMGDEGRSTFAYEACKTASFLLWTLSGRKYSGVTTVTEKYECPTRSVLSSSRYHDPALFPFEPYMASGAIYNSVGGNGCACGGSINNVHTKIRLRGRPVLQVSRVSDNGVDVDPEKYRLVNRSVLQASSGTSLDLCGLDVTYTYGVEPPAAGRRAARYLAQELTKSFEGKDCELPERVTSVSRQGVSVTVLDNQTFLDDHRTGIYAVDLFLKAVNPEKARKKVKVFSPDLPKATRSYGSSAPTLGPTDLGIVPGESFEWRLPLSGQYGELLTDIDWSPQGQISTWSGAIVFDVEPDRFEVVGDELVLTLSASETSRINLAGSGSWDLYAVNNNNPSTVIHVMNSNVYLVGQSSTATIV